MYNKKGAFDLGYKNKKGSIYYLKPDSFKENMTSFTPEIFSEIPVEVEKEGKLMIFMFPNTPEGRSSNKEDIVERGVNWTIDFGENTLGQIKEYHPDVLDRVIKGLQGKGYVLKQKSD